MGLLNYNKHAHLNISNGWGIEEISRIVLFDTKTNMKNESIQFDASIYKNKTISI